MGVLARTLRRDASRLRRKRVVVLPDFFLDHFVPLPSLAEAARTIKAIHGRGGGNLLTRGHLLRVGGNAANTAYVLGRLGVPTSLIARCDPVGMAVLESSLGEAGVNLTGVHVGDSNPTTVALEFRDGANVMLSDSGELEKFGPAELGRNERSILDRGHIVMVTNWSQMRRAGTALLRTVLARAHARGAFTCIDTGDPTHRGRDGLALLRDAKIRDSLDAWSMNENELGHFAGLLTRGSRRPLSMEASLRVLAAKFPGRIDLHTRKTCVSREGNLATRVPTFDFEPLRRTGAGDAWNAGNLAGGILAWPAAARLTLANAVAACTMLSSSGEPPRLGDVVAWLEDHPEPAARTIPIV